MKDIINQSVENIQLSVDKILGELQKKFDLVSDVINGLPVFVSSEKVSEITEFDEKHYFVIPYHLSETGIALHTMRCLPDDVPEINDLPKRRIFHFSNEHAEYVLQHYLLEAVQETVNSSKNENMSSLESLANNIDQLDTKLTYGMLIVGGLAALVNPVIGAGIAMKAILPGIGGILNKHGLRPIGEKLTEANLKKQINQAEEDVLKQFKAANTLRIVNPILRELELALNTTESEHDPLTDFDLSDGSLNELDGTLWRNHTKIAIYHIYKDIINQPEKYDEAKLGPEDIRWFKVLFSNIEN